MIYSDHARAAMRRRRVSEHEIEYVAAGSHTTSPGKTSDRINISGNTEVGRRIRLTVLKEQPDFVITVAVEKEA